MAILARLSSSTGLSLRRSVAGLSRRNVERIVDLLCADLSADVDLTTMAATVSLSPFHFARAFKASTGVPPHRYLMQLRVEKARKLLEGTDLPIGEVASEVGYDDPSYLARLFRREVGTTPAQYRRKRRS
jgi:AraC family transcriptional regulator